VLALLPLVAHAKPSTGSFASVTLHGKSFAYNHGHHGPAPTYRPAPSYQPTTTEATTSTEAAKEAESEAPSYPAPPAYPQHQPQYGYQPSYRQPAYHHSSYHKPSYHQPSYHQPHYGYEKPKFNCSIEQVSEAGEVCVPTVETTCEEVEIAIKRVISGEYCYEVARTECTETDETVDNEICIYNYEKKYEDTSAQTVEVTFKQETNVQMVTVCQPGHGYGYHSYGHQYCKEVAQETNYNVPVVSPKDVPVRVGYPEAEKTCVNKPITIPRIRCETVTEEKCVEQPEIEDDVQTLEKCTTRLGEPACEEVELSLPKQVCKELVYGYAEDKAPHYNPYNQHN